MSDQEDAALAGRQPFRVELTDSESVVDDRLEAEGLAGATGGLDRSRPGTGEAEVRDQAERAEGPTGDFGLTDPFPRQGPGSISTAVVVFGLPVAEEDDRFHRVAPIVAAVDRCHGELFPKSESGTPEHPCPPDFVGTDCDH